MPTLSSHTHYQAAQANAQTQAWQRVCLRNRTEEKRNNEGTTLYKRNTGFIAKMNISSRNKILDIMKISSSKTRTTLILDRWR